VFQRGYRLFGKRDLWGPTPWIGPCLSVHPQMGQLAGGNRPGKCTLECRNHPRQKIRAKEGIIAEIERRTRQATFCKYERASAGWRKCPAFTSPEQLRSQRLENQRRCNDLKKKQLIFYGLTA